MGRRQSAQTTPKLTYRVPEAAAATGLSVSFVYAEVAAGRWPAVRTGRTVLIPAEWLEKWVSRAAGDWERARDEAGMAGDSHGA